jgi:hypothetical protein
MTHFCHECKHEWFNNFARERCPMCGSHNVAHHFDEDECDDRDDPIIDYDFEEEEEDDE